MRVEECGDFREERVVEKVTRLFLSLFNISGCERLLHCNNQVLATPLVPVEFGVWIMGKSLHLTECRYSAWIYGQIWLHCIGVVRLSTTGVLVCPCITTRRVCRSERTVRRGLTQSGRRGLACLDRAAGSGVVCLAWPDISWHRGQPHNVLLSRAYQIRLYSGMEPRR